MHPLKVEITFTRHAASVGRSVQECKDLTRIW